MLQWMSILSSVKGSDWHASQSIVHGNLKPEKMGCQQDDPLFRKAQFVVLGEECHSVVDIAALQQQDKVEGLATTEAYV